MKIELKNIQFNEQLSEETNAFAANLYIEGVKVGSASNRGQGGPTDYRASDDKGKKLIVEAEAFCQSLPPRKSNFLGEEREYPMDLESYIDNLLHEHLIAKDIKKFENKVERSMEKGVVVGVPGKEFSVWQFNIPTEQVLQHPKGPEMIKNMLAKDILPRLVGGKIVMNTNIPLKILQDAGLNENQYTKVLSNEAAIKKQEKKDKPPIRGRKI